MLELEFVDSPDGDVVGKSTLYFDEVTVGRSRGNVIIVEDPDMELKDIHLSVVDSGVFRGEQGIGTLFFQRQKNFGQKASCSGRPCQGGGHDVQDFVVQADSAGTRRL